MPAPSDLPAELMHGPFTVSRAVELGVGVEVLRGARFTAPFSGVRVPASLENSLELRCRAALLTMPGDARLSHLTAAWLRSVPLPGQWQWSDEPVHVRTASRGPRPRGITVHPSPGLGPAVQLPSGLPVSDAASTWADLATALAVDDLVVAGDALLRHGWVDGPALTDAVRARAGWRNVRRLQAALPLLEPRTDSPMETRLRLLIVRAGLPRPVANRDVVVDGGWLGRPDLSYPALKIAIEYDGDHHRTDRRQWMNDKARRHLLEDHGWQVIELVADDILRRPQATVDRIRRAVADRSR